MSNRRPTNIAASVRQRLLNLSREGNVVFDFILTWYAEERLLYRISRSKYASQFVLKGATLLTVWLGRSYRPTRDLDFLRHGDASPQQLAEVFEEICQTEVEPDGLEFDPESIQITEIQEGLEYQGQRIKMRALLDAARIDIQVDIGYGDAVLPEANQIDYPSLLGFSEPRVWAYPPETVISEKLQTMVRFGMANSRMRDFYDVLVVSKKFSFDGPDLVGAIKATFERRATSIPESTPVALTDEFSTDEEKGKQWKGFWDSKGLKDATIPDLKQTVDELKEFLLPPMSAAGTGSAFNQKWSPGGPWAIYGSRNRVPGGLKP